jgi:hypothetical protein
MPRGEYLSLLSKRGIPALPFAASARLGFCSLGKAQVLGIATSGYVGAAPSPQGRTLNRSEG